jgi:hypothetical protein
MHPWEAASKVVLNCRELAEAAIEEEQLMLTFMKFSS